MGYASIPVIMAALLLGFFAGLLTFKRSQQWCPSCGTTLCCPACGARRSTPRRLGAERGGVDQ